MALRHSPYIVTDSLIGYWDAANYKSYNTPDSSTDWYDLSGNKNHAALTGVNGDNLNNGILTFDEGEYGTVIGSSTTNIQGSMTAALYIKSLTSGWNYYWCGISKYSQFILGPNGNTPKRMAFLVNNGGWYPAGYNGDIWGQQNLDIEKYHYYVGVYDESNNNLRLYVDGELEAEHTTANIMVSDTGPFTIAKHELNAGYLRANIGIIQLYNKPLTPSEVKQNFTALRGRFGL